MAVARIAAVVTLRASPEMWNGMERPSKQAVDYYVGQGLTVSVLSALTALTALAKQMLVGHPGI